MKSSGNKFTDACPYSQHVSKQHGSHPATTMLLCPFLSITMYPMAFNNTNEKSLIPVGHIHNKTQAVIPQYKPSTLPLHVAYCSLPGTTTSYIQSPHEFTATKTTLNPLVSVGTGHAEGDHVLSFSL
jgi:hypothetical protein